MIGQLTFEHKQHTYELSFDSKLNAITGDSATGKSAIVNILSHKRYANLKCTYKLLIVTEVEMLEAVTDGTMLLIDTDAITHDVITGLKRFKDLDVCIVLLGRRYLSNVPLPEDSVYCLNTSNNVTKNVKYDFSEDKEEK